MGFQKGHAKLGGRKKGEPNKVHWDLKEALQAKGPDLARELVDIALNCKNSATRVLAIRECFDRMLGKASQPLEGSITHGISKELQQLLERHDGTSRSVPDRNNGIPHCGNGVLDRETATVIEHQVIEES